MSSSPVNTAEKLTLATKRMSHCYTALISTRQQRSQCAIQTHVLWRFKLIPFGHHPKGGRGFRLETQHRCLLNNNHQPIAKLNRAQEIALITAAINNLVVVRTNRHFELLAVHNTERIRQQWAKVRSWLLQDYPNANVLADNFDWQLQDEHIQDLYHYDPFYQFFFAGIFDRTFPIRTRKTLANLLGPIPLPVSQEITASGQDPATVEVTGELDTGASDFPIEKINVFLGQLLGKSDANPPFIFTCKGTYSLHPEKGVITEGNYTCLAEIEEVYRKKTSITFNLEE